MAANTPIADSEFTASQAVLPEGDPNRVCVWPNRDMFGVDTTNAAGKAWYASLAKQYAAWGVDYIKCDDIANLQRGRYRGMEIETLSRSLRASGRSVVFSLSPGPAPVNQALHLGDLRLDPPLELRRDTRAAAARQVEDHGGQARLRTTSRR